MHMYSILLYMFLFFGESFILDRYIALPAWNPVISLESIDGATWRTMRNDFNRVLSVLPPVTELQVYINCMYYAMLHIYRNSIV